jgi:hypothetical protein
MSIVGAGLIQGCTAIDLAHYREVPQPESICHLLVGPGLQTTGNNEVNWFKYKLPNVVNAYDGFHEFAEGTQPRSEEFVVIRQYSSSSFVRPTSMRSRSASPPMMTGSLVSPRYRAMFEQPFIYRPCSISRKSN